MKHSSRKVTQMHTSSNALSAPRVCVCLCEQPLNRGHMKNTEEKTKKNQQRKTANEAFACDHLMHHLTIQHCFFCLCVCDASAALGAICSITITIYIRCSFLFTHSHVSVSLSVSVPFSMCVVSTQILVFFSIFGHKLTSILYTHI